MSVMSIRLTETNSAPMASDELLVQQLRDGDMHGGEELVRRYQQPLGRYLGRLCGNEQLAEELLQQTWLSVMEHLGRFDASAGSGGFRAWLFRIATNKANDYWRSRGRERAAKSGLRLVIEGEVPHAGHAIEAFEQGEKLKQAIERLPEAQREVLLLRYYADMKFIEIAHMLGCPLNTALGRMHKAMLKLRDLMSEEGEAYEQPAATTRE
jgi:RNA polymerase sigma-70 factor, ECF subfamily